MYVPDDALLFGLLGIAGLASLFIGLMVLAFGQVSTGQAFVTAGFLMTIPFILFILTAPGVEAENTQKPEVREKPDPDRFVPISLSEKSADLIASILSDLKLNPDRKNFS